MTTEYLKFCRAVRTPDETESILSVMRSSGFSAEALADVAAGLAAEDAKLAAVLAYELGSVEGATPQVAALAQLRESIRLAGPGRSSNNGGNSGGRP